MIKLNPFQYDPKIVWLDTNVINDIADAFCNEKNSENQQYNFLYTKLKDLVDKNKIICPFLKQRDEYINTDKYETCDRILLNLGKGKQLKTYLTEYSQINRMLEIYINKRDEFCFLKSDIPFYGDMKDGYNKKSNLNFSVVMLQSGQKKNIKTMKTTY